MYVMLHAPAGQLLHLKLLLTRPLTQNLCHGVNSTNNIIHNKIHIHPRCAQVSFGDLRRVIVVCVCLCAFVSVSVAISPIADRFIPHIPLLGFDHRVFH